MTEKNYLDMLKYVKDNGTLKKNRTGIDTKSIFGHQLRFSLQQGFPLLTTKKIHTKSIIYELLWFLNGDTNVKYLQDNGVRIWNEWADQNGNLGPVYGHQWRKFGEYFEEGCAVGHEWKDEVHVDGIDQITNLMDEIKKNPFSRRLIVSAWNPKDVPKMALPPCHSLFQFNIRPDDQGNPKYLDCQLYQRSADIFLGVPFNIASYALLTHMVAHVANLEVGDFVHSFGDVHLYVNHIEQSELQLSRDIRDFPKLKINRKVESIFDFKFEDFEIIDYNPHPPIKADVAV